jgi:hypothetical protein
MQDLGFIVAAWGVILGGLTAYAVLLVRRLAVARRTSILIRRQAESAPPPDPTA